MISSCNLHSFLRLPPSVPHSIFHLIPPPLPTPVSTRLRSCTPPYIPFLSSSLFINVPLTLLNSCLFLHLSVTHHFSFAFTPSLIRVLFSYKTCLCSFLEFHSPQNAKSSLLVATRDTGATNAAISRHLNESNFLLHGLSARPYIYLSLKLSAINAN